MSLLESFKNSMLCSPVYARCEPSQGEIRSIDNIVPGRTISAAMVPGKDLYLIKFDTQVKIY